MKKLWLTFFTLTLIFFSCSPNIEEGIVGLWKSHDQHSDKPQALVVIYKYKRAYYGRMLATYDDNGKIKDSILEKKEKATGVVGNPPYCGLDFIYDVKKEENSSQEQPKYEGKIIDPEKGKTYNVELWREGKDLVVRGEVWIFGKNILWPRATKADLPPGFSMNQVKKFVPLIPETTS